MTRAQSWPKYHKGGKPQVCLTRLVFAPFSLKVAWSVKSLIPVFVFRVLDHDTYSAHDAIGKVYIDLNPLLAKEHASVISGWFPIYDTMHGESDGLVCHI